jgi:hypothetical protein
MVGILFGILFDKKEMSFYLFQKSFLLFHKTLFCEDSGCVLGEMLGAFVSSFPNLLKRQK